jgi:hypothetical protein
MAGKTTNKASVSKGSAEPSSTALLLQALTGPDDALGKILLVLFIREEAHNLGIPTDQIPEDFAEIVVEHVKSSETNSAENAAVQIALHKAANGDFENAGRFIREHLIKGAEAIKFIPIGINKSKQAKEYGSRGATQQKEIGRANRQKIGYAIKKIMASRKSKPTDRQLASLVETETGIKFETVRGHIKKMGKNTK